MEDRAEERLDELEIDSIPTHVDRIAKRLGALVRYSPLDSELSGMVFQRSGQIIVGVNSLHHPNRQRFTIAHEIGHIRLHAQHITESVHIDKGFEVPMLRRDPTSAQGTERREIEANNFAAALLLPRKHLAQVFASFSGDIVDETPIAEIARRFKVSPATLNYRIRNLPIDLLRPSKHRAAG